MNLIFSFLIQISILLSFASIPVKSEILIQDDFSNKKLKGYDKSHIAKNKKNFKSYEFISENGNTYIRLSSKVGQLSKFNKGESYIKDRIELGTKETYMPRSWKKIENQTYWWSFDVKVPETSKETRANNIVITQLKTIEKNSKKKQCHPGMPFRISYNNKTTTISVTNGFDRKVKRGFFYENFLNNTWNNFKIGYHFSRDKGWVKVFKNNKLIFEYIGETMFTEYRNNCKPVTKLQSFIRIGIYRSSPSKNTGPDSLDFDNYYVCRGSKEDCNLNFN